ncbi:mitochondrial import inner membrane translocase subunit TIM23-1 [Artemisia annua]|uniref:Mitochondrial import inner membrane translocase subunit TIM23-1 n=1 Tax=Artemisia annua TaxID=35608 RepID=A0A2U1KPC2_ARTAN|nr:mitochondrial import inner membrane translocase subunit TIM23-1 [Artemisia annua]
MSYHGNSDDGERNQESIAQRRSWGENLTYYTGIGYLSGAVLGAGKGTIEGVKAFETGDTLKLRVNRVLNAGGLSGRMFGNRAGVIGLLYAGMESGMVAVRDVDDVFNSVAAGLGTGALFKAASGVRMFVFFQRLWSPNITFPDLLNDLGDAADSMLIVLRKVVVCENFVTVCENKDDSNV